MFGFIHHFLVFSTFITLTRCFALPNMSMNLKLESFRLTPVLKEHVENFHAISDDKLRYQELLHMATNCPPIKNKYKTLENKVPGCLSTVYVHAELKKDGRISFTGDADSQMSKGLLALLVEGLTDNLPGDIENIDPAFSDYAGIGSSLTIGRNNGFMNMLALMKLKAHQLDKSASKQEIPVINEIDGETKVSKTPKKRSTGAKGKDSGASKEVQLTGPMHQSILSKLQSLQPSMLTVENISTQHKGHSGTAKTVSKETNFNVHIVGACFEGKSLVERHKVVYALLEEELANGLHALSIIAKTPDEVKSSL